MLAYAIKLMDFRTNFDVFIISKCSLANLFGANIPIFKNNQSEVENIKCDHLEIGRLAPTPKNTNKK